MTTHRTLAARLMPQSVGNMAMTYVLSRALHAAAILGLADLLAERARGCAELAAETGTHAGSLQRLLRALAAFGVFEEQEDGRFVLNDMARRLQKDAPDSERDFVLYMGSDWLTRAWSDFLATLQSGQSYFERAGVGGVFEYFESCPEDGQQFDRSMKSLTAAALPSLVAACEVVEGQQIVDVGGGDGTLLTALLAAGSTTRGVLVERPACIATARAAVASTRVADRCEFVEGDIFNDRLPTGDVYVMKHILHDWKDDRASHLLRNVRRAMPRNARLLVIEIMMKPGQARPHEALMDLSMLLLTGGRERSHPEYAALLAAAGLRLARVMPNRGPYAILESFPD